MESPIDFFYRTQSDEMSVAREFEKIVSDPINELTGDGRHDEDVGMIWKAVELKHIGYLLHPKHDS